MANPAWPSSLPDVTYPAREAGYAQQAADPVLRTAMDAGPPKARQRFSAVPRVVELTLYLDEAQTNDLETFYWTTCGPAGLFDWKDHRTRQPATYRFLEPPRYQAIGAGWWQVRLKLEMQP